MHFVGDAHQPLHASTGCSSAHPQGDRGGNEFHIQSHVVNDFHGHRTTVGELHLLWDLCGGTYAAGPNWPMNITQDSFLKSEANRILGEFEASGLDEGTRSSIITEVKETAEHPVKYFIKIRDESHDYAEKYAYKNIQEDALISDDYLKAAQAVSAKRVAAGGFRLQGFLEAMDAELKRQEALMAASTEAPINVMFA